MTWIEAVEQMRSGKNVRHPSMSTDKYWMMSHNQIVSRGNRETDRGVVHPDLIPKNLLKASNWQVAA